MYFKRFYRMVKDKGVVEVAGVESATERYASMA